ncbi:general stress protein [Paenibacillus sp. YPG26]|uniref:general stress protein n=1 Tax=Paenibacillus sp. YPG26 TaxID=2878915 RepID=UPI00203E9BD8|nr:general stress protein [Paenibacillus sp. YPG26]USB32624.1 general stress protein [Paenibacillus sp. YPG26]
MSIESTKSYAKIVQNGVQAVETVKELGSAGYLAENIYVLAHDQERTDRIVDATEAHEVGLKEEGVFQSLANLFRSRGDELRSKIESLGFTETEAEFYEKELDQGKVLVVAVRS